MELLEIEQVETLRREELADSLARHNADEIDRGGLTF